jgi:hypothetical protein
MIHFERFKSLANLATLAAIAMVTTISSAHAHINLALQENEAAQIACPSGTVPVIYGDMVRCQTACTLVVTSKSNSYCSDQGPCAYEYSSQFALYGSDGKQVLFDSAYESYKEQEVIRQIKADFAQSCPLINVINH